MPRSSRPIPTELAAAFRFLDTVESVIQQGIRDLRKFLKHVSAAGGSQPPAATAVTPAQIADTKEMQPPDAGT